MVARNRALDAAWDVLAVVPIVFGIAVTLRVPSHLSLDSAMLIESATRVVEGYRPYVDFVDTNPPMATYLHLPVVLAARATGLGVVALFHTMVAGTLVYAAATARWVLRRAGLREAGSMVAVALGALSLFALGHDDWGQREHLFGLVVVPYLLLRASRPEVPSGAAVAIGLVAGLAGSIKPHFLLVVAAAELVLLLRDGRRWADPALTAFIGAGVLYGLHFLLWPADVRHALLEVWAPVVVAAYDAHYGMPVNLLLAKDGLALPEAVVVPILIAAMVTGPRQQVAIPMAAAALAAVVAYVLQHKGWNYQLLPAWSILLMVVALAADEIRARFPDVAALPFAGACLVLLGMCALAGIEPVRRPPVLEAVVLAHSQPGDRVLFWSSTVDPAFPFVTLNDRRQNERFLSGIGFSLLPDPPYEDAGGVPWEEAGNAFVASLHADLADQPALVVVDARPTCPACVPGRSVIGQVRRLDLADSLEDGRTFIGSFQGFEIWQRNPPGSP